MARSNVRVLAHDSQGSLALRRGPAYRRTERPRTTLRDVAVGAGFYGAVLGGLAVAGWGLYHLFSIQ